MKHTISITIFIIALTLTGCIQVNVPSNQTDQQATQNETPPQTQLQKEPAFTDCGAIKADESFNDTANPVANCFVNAAIKCNPSTVSIEETSGTNEKFLETLTILEKKPNDPKCYYKFAFKDIDSDGVQQLLDSVNQKTGKQYTEMSSECWFIPTEITNFNDIINKSGSVPAYAGRCTGSFAEYQKMQ